MDTPSVAVVIPVYNDADALDALLPRLADQWPKEEIVVVDGTSEDASAAIARRHGVQLIASPQRGRAAQMNLGARHCPQDALWFLHADAVPPPNAKRLIQDALAAGCVGGAFQRRFDSSSQLLRATCRLADWRARLWGWYLGDQAIFVRREHFAALGGFPDLPAFEDLEFSRSLAKRGRLAFLDGPLLTSARRFERRGPLRQTLADLRLTLSHLRR